MKVEIIWDEPRRLRLEYENPQLASLEEISGLYRVYDGPILEAIEVEILSR